MSAFLFILGNSIWQFLCWLNQWCGTQDVFALIWLKRQHGSGSRGEKTSSPGGKPDGATDRGFYLFMCSNDKSWMHEPSFSLSLFLFVSASVRLPIFFPAGRLSTNYYHTMQGTLTSHFIPFSLSFHCLFCSRNVNFTTIPVGILKCVLYVVKKCFF